MHHDSPLSTGALAAAAYRSGVEALLAGRTPAAIVAFARSVEADPAFALGHVALGVARAEAAGPDDTTGGADPLDRSARGVARWERQHVTVIRLVLDGDVERAAALGREHLAEYPDDAIVRFAVTRHCADVDDLASGQTSAAGSVASPRANASS